MDKITPYLWFDKQAEEAMNFYVDVFNGSPGKKNDSKIISIQYYPDNVDNPHMKGMEGKVLNGIFELDGQKFMALDGGPFFKFNESFSLYVECENQEEVDYFWNKLSAMPESEQCGWLKDTYGLSWQIIPKQLEALMSAPDKEKTGRVMQALLQMKKLDVSKLQDAYDGK